MKPNRQRHGRRVLLALLAMSALPIVAAQLVYDHWRPAGGESFGELIASPVTGNAARWRLAAVGADGCGARTRSLLFSAGQLQRAQGEAATRIETATTAPCASTITLGDHPLLTEAGLYLIDPNGNAVLRYRPEQLADAVGRKRALQEIGKLLKQNRGLGGKDAWQST
ncbi:hypothetical protein [Jeongeupia chitinilytica]|uniref:Transmembrane protein n=1 Tax=Jeongeupia chitinilytica TaxID=1041641 RepID=A0ABQ3H358_9NEIS|nr:hypothetical protein [Jeongeupia chitinilytica]GHD68105.1 hypothetical protein GCM10007350_32800 [Jeongeupia chitinilytica]